jgi:hypothetical protein
LKNDYSKENSYIISHSFACVKNTKRKLGLASDFINIQTLSNFIDYPESNLIHFDISIHVLAYFEVTRVSNCIIPSYSIEASENIKKFIFELIEKLGFEKYGKNSLLIKDTFKDIGYDREYWKRNYNKLPNDMKFYIDQTNLKPKTAFPHLLVCNLMENNTLNLPSGAKLIKKKPRIPIFFHTFPSPRL